MSINIPIDAVQRKFEDWLHPSNRFLRDITNSPARGSEQPAYFPPNAESIFELISATQEAQAPLRLVGVYGDHGEGVHMDVSHFNEAGLLNEESLTLPVEFGTQIGPTEQFLRDLGLRLDIDAPSRERLGPMFYNGCFKAHHIPFAIDNRYISADLKGNATKITPKFGQLAQDGFALILNAALREAPEAGVWIEATFPHSIGDGLMPHLDRKMFNIRHAYGISGTNTCTFLLHCEGDSVRVDDFERHWHSSFSLMGASEILIERNACEIVKCQNQLWTLGARLEQQWGGPIAGQLLSWHDFPRLCAKHSEEETWILDLLNHKISSVQPISADHRAPRVYRPSHQGLHSSGLMNPVSAPPIW